MGPLIPIAISLATKFAPALLGRLAGDKAEETAQEVCGIAQVLTGAGSPEKAEQIIDKDPALALEYKKSMQEYELGIYREDTKRLDIVNQTIRAEMTSKDPYNSRWRATFGYAVAITWFSMFVMAGVAFLVAFFRDPKSIGDVAEALGTMFSSTSMLWTMALAILGVTVHKRSKDKETAAGNPASGLLNSVLGAIKK